MALPFLRSRGVSTLLRYAGALMRMQLPADWIKPGKV
jgi:hypothetical protein